MFYTTLSKLLSVRADVRWKSHAFCEAHIRLFQKTQAGSWLAFLSWFDDPLGRDFFWTAIVWPLPGKKLSLVIVKEWNRDLSFGWNYILDVPAFELNGAILIFFRRIVLENREDPQGGGVYALRFKEVTIPIDKKTVSWPVPLPCARSSCSRERTGRDFPECKEVCSWL